MCRYFTDDEMRNVVRDMINHFRDGTGSNYSNSILTERAREHSSTKAYVNKMLEQLKIGLDKNNGDLSAITPDYWMDNLDQGHRPSYGSWRDILTGLTITIHDTWANSIIVENYTFDGENYSGTMKLTIYDHFGLDELDVDNSKLYNNLSGFRAWFLLQHYDKFEGRYRPFVTVIELEYPFEGSLD